LKFGAFLFMVGRFFLSH